MMPPLTTSGRARRSPARRAIIDVVVVLPWVPAMAIADSKPHQLGQHLGPAHQRHAPCAGRDQLRIVGLDRRGDDDHLGAVDVLGVVADRRPCDAERRQPLGVGARRRRSPAPGSRVRSISAMPLMPMPPMPTKCSGPIDWEKDRMRGALPACRSPGGRPMTSAANRSTAASTATAAPARWRGPGRSGRRAARPIDWPASGR